MSIPKDFIYGGVQVVTAVSETNKISGVHTQGVVNPIKPHIDVTLATTFGLSWDEEMKMRQCNSVYFSGSRNHVTGLTEYFIKIPLELARKAGFQTDEPHFGMPQYASIVYAKKYSQDSASYSMSYILRPAIPKPRKQFPNPLIGILLWQAEKVGKNAEMLFVPEIQNSLVEVIHEHEDYL